MRTDQLVEEAGIFFDHCMSRLEGVGAEQYYNAETERQDFEDMSPAAILDMAIEEAVDLANYAFFTAYRINELRNMLPSPNG